MRWVDGSFALGLAPWIFIVAIIDIILKGIALYRSARASQKYWFVAILFINSAGVLPLIYLWLNRKRRKK